MRKFLLFFGMLIVAVTASAVEYKSMCFTTSDGNSHFISLEGLEISVDNSNLLAKAGEESLTLPVSNLVSMEFSETLAAVDAVEANGESSPVIVYGIDGTVKGSYGSALDATESLPAGLYIIKAANTQGSTSKLSVRK